MTGATVVVGGGPAGSAAAIGLAHAGLPVTLIERTTGPHDTVCGDFLSGPALSGLRALGVDAAALGGVPIGAVRVIYRQRIAEARLPFPALGLSRRVLDEALLGRAHQAGALVRRGKAVRAVAADANGLVLELMGSDLLRSPNVVLATGKHDLRGAARPGREGGAMGVKSYIRLAADQAAASAGCVELILLPGGYAGLQPAGHGVTVLCLMARRPPSRRGGPKPRQLVDWLVSRSPHLDRRLAGASVLEGRALGVAGLPYGHLHRPEGSAAPGLFRVGDQAAVIPSLVGDGVAIALISAAKAVQAIIAGEAAEAYHWQLTAALKDQMRAAMLVHRAALSPWLQPLIVQAGRLWPGLIGFTAGRTRCYEPDSAPLL